MYFQMKLERSEDKISHSSQLDSFLLYPADRREKKFNLIHLLYPAKRNFIFNYFLLIQLLGVGGHHNIEEKTVVSNVRAV